MVCRLVYGKREISSTSLLCHHVQELQIICTVLHRAGAAFYGNTATEESVPQRESVVRTCFASNLTHACCCSLVAHPPPFQQHNMPEQQLDKLDRVGKNQLVRGSKATTTFIFIGCFVLRDISVLLLNRELIFCVNRLEPVWVIQVSSNNGSMRVAMNHVAPLERSLDAIFKQEHPSGRLSDERIAERRRWSGRGARRLQLWHSFIFCFSSGDSGLNQFPGDHAYHISELQGRKMVRRASLPLFNLLHFLIAV